MSDDELALLRAVEARPDDDLPRLVYADWLDEQGRHVRAEFIRVQCELARLKSNPTQPADSLEYRNLHHQLLLQQSNLLKSETRADAIGEAVNLLGKMSGPGMERGFVTRFEVHCDGLITPELDVLHAASLVPRPWLAVWHLGRELRYGDVEQLGSGVFWAEIDEIGLAADQGDSAMLPHELIPMTRVEYPRLQTLYGDGCEFNEGAVCIFAERLRAPQLRELSLRNNQILDPSFRHLAKAVFAPTLEVLDLSDNPLSRPTLGTLTQDRFPSLQQVVLNGCRIVPDVLVRLREQLPGVAVECDRGNA